MPHSVLDLICSEVQLFATGEQTLDLIAYIRMDSLRETAAV